MPNSTRHISVIGMSIWVKQYPFLVSESLSKWDMFTPFKCYYMNWSKSFYSFNIGVDPLQNIWHWTSSRHSRTHSLGPTIFRLWTTWHSNVFNKHLFIMLMFCNIFFVMQAQWWIYELFRVLCLLRNGRKIVVERNEMKSFTSEGNSMHTHNKPNFERHSTDKWI